MAPNKPKLRRNPPRLARPKRRRTTPGRPRDRPVRQPGPPGTFPFLDLPPEVRKLVYEYFEDKNIMLQTRKCRSRRRQASLFKTRESLLSVSQFVRSEFLPYRWNHGPLVSWEGQDFEKNFLSFARQDTIKAVRKLVIRFPRSLRQRRTGYLIHDWERVQTIPSLLQRWPDLLNSLEVIELCMGRLFRYEPATPFPARGSAGYGEFMWRHTSRNPQVWEAVRRRFQPRSRRHPFLANWQAVRQIRYQHRHEDLPWNDCPVHHVVLKFRKNWEIVPPADTPGQNELEWVRDKPCIWGTFFAMTRLDRVRAPAIKRTAARRAIAWANTEWNVD